MKCVERSVKSVKVAREYLCMQRKLNVLSDDVKKMSRVFALSQSAFYLCDNLYESALIQQEFYKNYVGYKETLSTLSDSMFSCLHVHRSLTSYLIRLDSIEPYEFRSLFKEARVPHESLRSVDFNNALETDLECSKFDEWSNGSLQAKFSRALSSAMMLRHH